MSLLLLFQGAAGSGNSGSLAVTLGSVGFSAQAGLVVAGAMSSTLGALTLLAGQMVGLLMVINESLSASGMQNESLE